MKKKYVISIYVGLVSISILVYIGFVAYSFIVKQCQDKYGLSYNNKRKGLGIPLLPADWSVKERSENYIGWSGNEKNIGHKRKSVTFSGCSIEGELDVFRLRNENGKERLLEIQYSYQKKTESSNVTYTYQIGHYAKSISKITADSLLNAGNKP
ncbi:hypothetical protein [Pedobacter sandarakinus]|uniref:hypothetical protein n=1 Tax=Pedobacter sandarakinus TaxID=353156 RepID=UPI002248741D|nr:hypothetical protein [Pedobacter sandarakinus]MCX2576370.1 hypothetical protein [Pedobacter sandarakinus]